MNKTDLFILILCWIGWCALHSGMISLSVTRYLRKKLRDSFKYYRFFYNVFALFTLIPLYLVSVTMEGVILFSWSGNLRAVQLALFAVSLLLFILGAQHYNLGYFLGIEQIKSGNNNSVMSQSGKLKTTGILGFTRHPWYLAGLILIWSSQQDIHITRFWINCVLSCYFIIGAFLEERKLAAELGQSYQEYSQQVSMLIPFKWLHAKVIKR